ncbi:putative T7SS-secreted protein [Streptomyces sp. NPDC093970]|uniref:putative T7SS-secreted protein n=1 Tax=Streptomyces sp. NPDC093970 TaxID=3155076 RepID=UPI003447A797
MAEARIEDFPALGFLPCPGDHTVADDVARTVRGTAKALDDICQVLHGTGVGDWKGKAAEAFRERFDDDFRPRMDDARDSFAQAAEVLGDWAAYMERRQKDAVRLESRAAEVHGQLTSAKDKASRIDRAESGLVDDKAKRDRKTQVQNAKGAVSAKEAELEELRHQGHRMSDDYHTFGKEIAGRLQSAMDIAPNEPGIWDRLGNALEGLGKALADLPEEVGQLLSDVGDWIKSHADWITVAASVVGVIAIFCPALAPLAIGLSALAFFAHASAYGVEGLWPPTGGNIGNWLTLGGDALGMVPGVGAAKSGIVAGFKAGRGTEGLVAGTRVGLKTAGVTAKNIMKAADPVAAVIDRPVMAVATKLGVSRGTALTVTEGVQAAATLAWTAPTAANAYHPTQGRYDAATWGTGVGNATMGTGGGKFGGLVAVGSAIGLGAWELTD